jgi:hypothetical protein
MKGLEPKSPEWLDDQRLHTRWVDARIATVRTAQREQPAMTGDISPGGMQLALVGDKAPKLAHQIAVDVAFEKDVVKLWGQIVYAVPKTWGLLVGVRFNPQPATVQNFLYRRYACSPDAQRGAGHH